MKLSFCISRFLGFFVFVSFSVFVLVAVVFSSEFDCITLLGRFVPFDSLKLYSPERCWRGPRSQEVGDELYTVTTPK